MNLITVLILVTALLLLICLPEFTAVQGPMGESLKIAALQ
jgi:hypothetical protein